MKSRRPYARAKPDKNNAIVPKALGNWGGGFSRDEYGVWQGHVHGLPVAAYDVSKLGGEFPDWLVAVSWLVIGFEVKEERPAESALGRKRELSDGAYYRSMLKDSEKAYFIRSPMLKFVVATEEQVWTKVIDAVEFVLYVDDSICLHGQPFVNLFFPKAQSKSDEQKFTEAFE